MDTLENKYYSNEIPKPAITIFSIIFLMAFFSVLGGEILKLLASNKGIAIEDIMTFLTAESDASDRNFVRMTALINQLSLFFLPGIVGSIFIYRADWLKELLLNRFPSFKNIGLGSLLILLAIPLIQFFLWLNMQLPLPEWMMDMEDNIQELLMHMLKMEHPYELFFNLFLIAVIPAIGEEIIFRGVLQKSLQKGLSNPHIAIWITAFIFSLIHFQFEGFIPRVALGGLLGYLFYWTNSLWVPIFAHFCNNAAQVLVYYFFSEQFASLDMEQQAEQTSFIAAFISLVAVLFIGYKLWQLSSKPEKLAQ